MTPPAPPMTVVHQRCVLLLKHLDEENQKLELEPDANKHKYSDYFLSEISAIMFQQHSQLKVRNIEDCCTWRILTRSYFSFSWKKCVPWRVLIRPSAGLGVLWAELGRFCLIVLIRRLHVRTP